uniref:Uncharacterized protein n=1 Tax=Oryza punctata TaxID=4537 RepID=A0A0E0LRS9_ORYPU
MASALASPTSPSTSTFLPAHLLRLHAPSASSGLQLAGANVLLRDDAPPETGRGPHHNAVLRQPPVMLAAAADPPTPGGGPHHNAVPQRKPRGGGELRLPASPPVILAAAAGTPEQGNGPKTNAVLRRPTPPGGAGPREGSGGRGGVIHAVVDASTPQKPGAPAEGAGGNGGAVHAAPAAAASS